MTYKLITSDEAWSDEESDDYYWIKEAWRQAVGKDPRAYVLDLTTGTVTLCLDEPEGGEE